MLLLKDIMIVYEIEVAVASVATKTAPTTEK